VRPVSSQDDLEKKKNIFPRLVLKFDIDVIAEGIHLNRSQVTGLGQVFCSFNLPWKINVGMVF
jgi:hypothetical protein